MDKLFDFNTPSEWDKTGDGDISGGQFSLFSVLKQLYWNVHNWNAIPTADGNGDYPLAATTMYYAHDDGAPYSLDDFGFCYWMKHVSGAGGATTTCRLHYEPVVGSDYVDTRFYYAGGVSMRQYFYRNDGAICCGTTNYSIATYHDWPPGSFRLVRVAVRGNEVYWTVGDEWPQMVTRLDLDETDGGTLGFYSISGDAKWVVGGGGGSSTPNPWLAQRQQGGIQLKEVNAWDLTNVEALGRIAALGDMTGGGGNALPADLRYNHYDGAWTGWLAPPADGDISSLTVGTGKKLRVGITDGSTGGLDTMSDEAFMSGVVDYVPLIDNILVTYTPTKKHFVFPRNEAQTGPRRGERE